MEEKQQRTAGFVIFGIMAVALILAIVGLCLPAIADTGTKGTGKISYGFFADEWGLMITDMTKASPALSIVGFVIAMVGIAAVIAHLVIKLFFKKRIKLLGILAALVTLVGGILIIVGGIIMATRMNTFAGGNSQMFDPGIGIWLGGIASILAAIAAFVAESKKFNG